MAETEKKARNVVRRLDFGVVRKKSAPIQKITPAPAKKPAESVKEPVKPAIKSAPKPIVIRKRPLGAPEAPRRPAAANRGFRMDFGPVRSRAPQMSSGAKKSPIAKKPQIAISTPSVTSTSETAVFKPRPTATIKATISRTRVEIPNTPVSRPTSRGVRMDFVRRPANSAARPAPASPAARPASARPAVAKTAPVKTAPVKPTHAKPTPVKTAPIKRAPVKEPVVFEDEEPPMSDEDLMAALSGFASAKNEEVPRRPRIFRPSIKPEKPEKPVDPEDSEEPAAKPARRAPVILKPTPKAPDPFDEFAEDVFGGDGFGDDIDRIEAEIEAEANDFVTEPRPLFEDPLVQSSKIREEQYEQLSPEEKAQLKNSQNAKRSRYTTLYSTKTPFITSAASFDKRPLSAAAPTGDGPELRKSYETSEKEVKKSLVPSLKRASLKKPQTSLKNRMQKQLDEDAKEIHRKTMVMSTPEVKERNTALIIGIALTILLGAGVGALIYLVFFQ